MFYNRIHISYFVFNSLYFYITGHEKNLNLQNI